MGYCRHCLQHPALPAASGIACRLRHPTVSFKNACTLHLCPHFAYTQYIFIYSKSPSIRLPTPLLIFPTVKIHQKYCLHPVSFDHTQNSLRHYAYRQNLSRNLAYTPLLQSTGQVRDFSASHFGCGGCLRHCVVTLNLTITPSHLPLVRLLALCSPVNVAWSSSDDTHSRKPEMWYASSHCLNVFHRTTFTVTTSPIFASHPCAKSSNEMNILMY